MEDIVYQVVFPDLEGLTKVEERTYKTYDGAKDAIKGSEVFEPGLRVSINTLKRASRELLYSSDLVVTDSLNFRVVKDSET